jgi:hypothetical protein
MAGLTQRKTTAAINSTTEEETSTSSSTNYYNGKDHHQNGSSNGYYPNGTTEAQDNASTATKTSIPTAANSKGKSLKERSAIPYSFYVTFGTIIGLQYFGGLYDSTTTSTTSPSATTFLRSWYTSLYQSIITLLQLLQYSRTILLSPPSLSSTTSTSATTTTATNSTFATWKEFLFVLTLWCVVILPLLYVFFIAPFRAGFWTGRKSNRHMFHRYMGLCYLFHYVLAWIEFFTNPSSSKTSYLCHIIAVMGKVFSLILIVCIAFCFIVVTSLHNSNGYVALSMYFIVTILKVFSKVHRHTFRSRCCRN